MGEAKRRRELGLMLSKEEQRKMEAAKPRKISNTELEALSQALTHTLILGGIR